MSCNSETLLDENGGYFVSRLKDCANPVITDVLWE